MAVPNIFAAATGSIPLSQLDANFNTAITLGNTAVYLGNTTTAFGNVTLNNPVLTGNVFATQSDQETATSTSTIVTPGRQQYHPSAAKAWGTASGNGTSLLASYNVTSITDNGTGDITFTYTTSFSSANYAYVATIEGSTSGYWAYGYSHATNNVRILNLAASGAVFDPTGPYSFAAFGDQ